ncbi:7 transmembrane sweet-taste receptor of 3 GCPR-domain-containing protein [Zopfochytrium polystomum]|nr:7 transmembrane sweet-taste receptor of 3 GCPR-domain-containing protein [Zopfochytrium polystomum]
MSPAFVAVILVGMLALELSALGWIGEFTAWKCHVETFVLPIAFSLLMGALFIKNYRLYKIFNNPYLMKSGLSNLELGLSVIAVVAPNLIVAIVWTIISPKQPKLTFVSLSSGQQSSYYLCASDSPKTDIIFLAVFYAYNIALVAATVWIAVVTRNVKAQLSESVYIGYSLYNAVATCIILIPLLFVGIITDFMVLFWFRAVILLYPVAFGFGMLFGKRVLYDTWLSEDQLNAAKSSKTPSILGSALRSASAVKESLTQSTLTCTVSILYQTGVMASWKRRTATYQVDTGMLALIEEPNQATGQFINMLHFALVRESNDPAVGHFSLAFAQLKTPLASASRTAAGAPPLPPNAPEKLVIDFESAAAFEAWAKHLRTGGAPKP